MKDRSLLIILAITVAFIFYVKPARQNIDLLKTRIAVLDSQIATQENIKKLRREIDGRVKATGAAASANEEFLYPAGKSSSLALVDLQETVKSAAAATHMEVVNSTWGEPVPDEKSGLTRIPMSFMVKGLPADMDQFLQRLLHGKRFIRAERASVTKFQDQLLVLNLSLVAFKREGKHE